MGTSTSENLCVKNTTTSRRELEIETNIVDAGVKAPRIGELEAYIETYLKDCV